nr:unnamed protein product [Spirometra erinaceieuropaei]
MPDRKCDHNDAQTGQSIAVPDVPPQTAQIDAGGPSDIEPFARSDATMVAAVGSEPAAKNQYNESYSLFFQTLRWDRTVLQHLADDQLDKALDAGLTRHTPFQVLCDQLQRLFQPPLTIEEAIDQLLKRSLRSDETPRQFADALLQLTRDAYPSLSAADRDQVVLFHFKRGLGSPEVTYSLRIQPPGDLNEAIQRASRMLTTDSPSEANHARTEPWKHNPDRRQQSSTWTRPHYPPSQRFNRGSRPPMFRTPHRPPPTNTEPRQFRGNRDSTAAAITKEGNHIIPVCFDYTSHNLPFYTTVYLDNKPVKALVDTGATTSLVREEVLDAKWLNLARQSGHSPHLKTADGSPMTTLGSVRLPISFPASVKEQTFVVTHKMSWDMILGLDFLSAHNCCIMVKDRILSLGHRSASNNPPGTEFDEEATCAAIAPSVALPPTSVDTVLPPDDTVTLTDKEELRSLLTAFSDVFAWDDTSLGRTAVIRHTIDTGTSKPLWQPPRRIPPHFQKEVNDLIQTMLTTGIIRPSRSPWASPVTLVPKKDGRLRFCIDYRRLNAVTTRDSFPLPRIDVTLEALAGAQWFSTLDLKSGYWQVEVEPSDRPKTAFILPQGLFEFETMPFGLCNAAATFQRLMQSVLAHLYPHSCLIYLDDVIVFGRTARQHNTNLAAVLSALRDAGLRLNPQKCKFLCQKVTFLGHEVSPHGIQASQEKVEAVRSWPTPKTPTEVRGFIGLASYYRRFILHFAELARPLHRLTEKGRPFSWTDDCQQAFDELKAKLTSAPILMLPDTSPEAPPFILDSDASGFAIGGVLSQADETGTERPICFASKTLSKPERNYCTYRRELLALITFIKQFKPFLVGKHFIVRTDHKALQWLQNMKEAEGQLARWQELLQEFDFTCQYRPGHQHANADALSRRPSEAGTADPEGPAEHIAAVTISEPTRYHWAVAQSTDPDSAIVYDHQLHGRHRPTEAELRGSSEIARLLCHQWANLFVENELLFFKDAASTHPRLVVPGSLVIPVLTDLHHELGHDGVTKTEAAARQRFWWPRLREQVANFCNACATCASFKGTIPRHRAPLQPMITGFPFERVGVDIVGPLPYTTSGHRYILVLVDYFTKWAEAIPLQRQDAASVTNALLKEWVCRYGAPFSLHSDCGANFESHLLREVCDLLLIHKTRTTPAHPEGNGQVERTNRTIINILKAFAEEHHPHDWDVKLPFAMMAYRAAVHSSTGHAPFHMLTGRQFRLPTDSNVPTQQPAAYTTDDYVIGLQELLRLTHNLARTQLRNAYDRQKNYFDRQAHGLPYHIGDLVLRYRAVPPVGTPAKFFHPWEGPFVVADVISPTTYIIRDALTHAGPAFTVHFDKLKPYHGSLPVASHDTLPIVPPHLVPLPNNEVEIPPDPHPPPGPADGALPRGGAVVAGGQKRLFE